MVSRDCAIVLQPGSQERNSVSKKKKKKNEEIAQINNLILYLNKTNEIGCVQPVQLYISGIEKKEQTKPRVSRKKEML